MIGCFNKPKVIFQGCHITQEPLGAVVASQHPDRNSRLQPGPLHFTHTELNLAETWQSTPHRKMQRKSQPPRKKIFWSCVALQQHLGSPGKSFPSHCFPIVTLVTDISYIPGSSTTPAISARQARLQHSAFHPINMTTSLSMGMITLSLHCSQWDVPHFSPCFSFQRW